MNFVIGYYLNVDNRRTSQVSLRLDLIGTQNTTVDAGSFDSSIPHLLLLINHRFSKLNYIKLIISLLFPKSTYL